MIGTWINIGTVLLGSAIGLLVGRRISDRLSGFSTTAIGLVTIVLGIKLALETQNVLVLLLSLIIGGGIGTLLSLEDRLANLGRAIERRFPTLAHGTIPQGFVTASLLFCVGPLSLIGALRDGLYGDWQLLGIKSVMDGISSVILVAGLGPGVFFSVLVILVYQGGVSLAARFFAGATISATAPPLAELDAVGGAILLALAFKLLDLRDLKAGNLLPALAVAPALAVLFHLFGG
ncbi:MAG TPA: DUF554 domain-containing protein [Candidatus Acetothermia bacterium]|nr:DUF554 domain-containing protein [Candidatus Bipolaricaulota bacterium]RLE40696.1 MAG: DUF554 domain-containing protein [Candidatus Acetothermia bacterium]HDJ30061.1 DUF554 domain-containing protein [Candidatus Acetothermia bacterium]